MERTDDAIEITLSWGGNPQCTELYEKAVPVRIGEAADADFRLPSEVLAEPLTLVEITDGARVLRIPAGTEARLARPGADGELEAIDVDELPAEADGTRRIRLAGGLVAQLEIGDFSFHVRSTERSEKIATRGAVDWRPWRWIGASALFHAFLVCAFMLVPPHAGAITIGMNDMQREYISIRLDAAERYAPEPEPADAVGPEGAATNEGRPMEGESGTAGAEDETRNTGGRVAVRGNDREARVPVRSDDVVAMDMFGTLAAMANNLAAVTADNGDPYAEGWAEEDAYGPLAMLENGFAPGTNGFDMLGTGRGGCPVGATNCAAGTVGSGDFNTVGTSGGCSQEDFARFERMYGRAGAMDRCSGTSRAVTGATTRMSREGGVPPRITPGPVTTNGGLSAEDIRRVVRRNIPQVRHCYEQELVQRPDLEGRVSVHFLIGPTGAVQSSQVQGSTVGNQRMESCVAQAVRRWPFPQSPGMTSVTYPFMFTTP